MCALCIIHRVSELCIEYGRCTIVICVEKPCKAGTITMFGDAQSGKYVVFCDLSTLNMHTSLNSRGGIT